MDSICEFMPWSTIVGRGGVLLCKWNYWLREVLSRMLILQFFGFRLNDVTNRVKPERLRQNAHSHPQH
jgi:hypothetical protein